MPKIPIFRLGGRPDKPALPNLDTSTPVVLLEGIPVGIDNLRHDVVLSPKFADLARAHIARVLTRHGDLDALRSEVQANQGPSWMRSQAQGTRPKHDAGEWKAALTELLVASLNRAKKESRLSVDLLARLAVTKFLRSEMNVQFAQVLERCRVQAKNYDNARQQSGLQYRERIAGFQVRKKIILRKTGQELFETVREVEKSTLGRTRRSLFGAETSTGTWFSYPRFMNRLLFSEDGRDDYLCAEHYVMLGNWDRDPDRYGRMREVASGFLRSIYGKDVNAETIRSLDERSRQRAGVGGNGNAGRFYRRCGTARQACGLGTAVGGRACHGKCDRLLLRRAIAQ